LKFVDLCRQYNIEPVPLVQGMGWAYGVVDINPDCAESIYIQDERHTLTGTAAVTLQHPNIILANETYLAVTNASKDVTYQVDTDYKLIPGDRAVRPFDPARKPWRIARIETGRITDGQEVLVSYDYVPLSKSQSPSCPSDRRTYDIVDQTLTHTIRRFRPKYIHIGHDEVIRVGTCSRCQKRGLSKTDAGPLR
jgi:hypothetical protein